MKRMKTFLIYFLIFIGFLIFSLIMEALYIYTSYVSIKDNGNVENASGIVLEVEKAKATNFNGVMSLKATNNNEQSLENKYIKIDLINKQNLVAATQYVQIEKIEPKQTLIYKVAFKARNIEKYTISITDEAFPVEGEVIDVFGVRIDVGNMVTKAIDAAHRMPDWVYTLLGLWASVKAGNIIWLVAFM